MADHEADGWAVMHDRSSLPPSEYPTYYLFGPLPTKEVADVIQSASECECRKTVVPLFFPAGVTMMVTALLPDTDMPTDGPVH